MGSQSKRKKGTKDNRSIVTDIKRETDQDASRTALQPTFEGIDYAALEVSTTDYVDVTDTIDPAQTNAPGAPPQVTGLTVTVIGNNQLNIAWNAYASPDLVNYNVYRSTTNGFTATSGNRIAQPVVNSLSDVAVNSGTTYYYRVAAVGAVGEGAISAQAQGTTTGSPPALGPNLWLKFDTGDSVDSSGNGNLVTVDNHWTLNATTGGPGQFGAAYYNCNTPSNVGTLTDSDYIRVLDNPNVQLDMTVGFSLSLWVYPTSLGPNPQYIYFKTDSGLSPNIDYMGLGITSAGIAVFNVMKDDVSYKTEISGLVNNVWNHLACTFDGATNTPKIYRMGVLGGVGTGTTATTQGGTQVLDVIIGKTPANGTPGMPWYRGRIDEVQYFKGTVLTQNQVLALMNTNNVNAPPPGPAPAQVTGLVVTVGADNNSLNLDWTNVAPPVDNYRVYMGNSPGFTPASPILSPTVSNCIVSGLTAGTPYYFRVSAVYNFAEGTKSNEATGTTSGVAPPIFPTFDLHFDNNILDSSPNLLTWRHKIGQVTINAPVFATPGKFGSHYILLNEPPDPSGDESIVSQAPATEPEWKLDVITGFTISCWIRPTVVPTISGRVFAVNGSDGNEAQLAVASTQMDFAVRQAFIGLMPVRKFTISVVPNTWYHVVCTYDAVAGQTEIYVNKVPGVPSASIPGNTVWANFFIGTKDAPAGALSTTYFRGGIDEFKLYNGIVATQAQVNNLFNLNHL